MFIFNYIQLFFIDFIGRILSLDFDILGNFIYNNIFLLSFILFTYLGIIVDSRFRFKNKIFIFFALSFFILLSIIFEYRDLHLFFRDLFWYTQILNFCFVVHVLYFHWIFLYFWKKRREKICWYVSLIAFILSMSFIVFLLNWLYLHLYRKYHLKYYLKVYKFTNKKTRVLFFINIILVITVILRFFIFIFIGYSSIIVGTYRWKKISLKQITMMICFFIFTLIISIYYLGISRIVFVWFIIFFISLLDTFYDYYKGIKAKNKKIKIGKIFLNFILDDAQSVILMYYERPAKIFFTNENFYKKNYKELHCRMFLISIFIESLNHIKKDKNIWNFLMKPTGISWYNSTLLRLKDIQNPNEENLNAELETAKEFFNLSEEEINQLNWL